MPHFCSIEDIKTIIPSGARFDDTYTRVRDAVSTEFEGYMRRDLSYKENAVEYFDSTFLGSGNIRTIYLERKLVTAIDVRYDTSRLWTDDNVISADLYAFDGDNGSFTLYGPMRHSKRTIKVTYTGGFATDGDGIMDVPPSIRDAAVSECVYRLNRLINEKSGQQEQVDRKQKVVMQSKVGGLLPENARALDKYRRTFMTVI